jgi:hypothetical protein
VQALTADGSIPNNQAGLKNDFDDAEHVQKARAEGVKIVFQRCAELVDMERATGLKPAAFGLGSRRSIN